MFNYYLEGGINNDFVIFSKVFYLIVIMKFVGEEYKEVNVLEFFEKGMKLGLLQDWQIRIVFVSVMGNVVYV